MLNQKFKKFLEKDRAKDFLSVLIFALTYLFLAFFLTRGKYIFGSETDFSNQHYQFPDYLRILFYETGDLLPDFAFNIGSGINIYSISYYGLLNPFVIFSYLLPFVEMLHYILAVMALIVIGSASLFYFYLKKNEYGWTASFLCAFMFLCATPIIFHAHRHIMFISYMPFLMMGFYGIDKYIYKGKSWLLVLSITLMIFTSYYFSISGMVVLILFGCFKFVRKNGFGFKKLFGFCIPFAVRFIIPLLISAVLVLPTFFILTSGRGNSESSLGLFDLIKPGFFMLYKSYSMGLTAVVLAAAIYMLFSKRIENKILSAILLLVSIFPIFNYVLNGFLYVNAKSLIPFIPLALVNTADFIFAVKDKIKFKKIAFAYLILVPLVICISINKTDELIKKSKITDSFIDQYKKSASELTQDDSSYRINSSTINKHYINRVTNSKEYKTTIYSSFFNEEYRRVYKDLFENPLKYRNEFMISAANNPIFQIYMGEKYIYTSDEYNEFYNVLDKFGEINLYENPYALPIGYATSDVINTKEFEKLGYPYNMINIIGRAVVDSKTTAEIIAPQEIKKIDYTAESVENLEYKKTDDGFIVTAKSDANAVFKLSNPNLTNKFLLICFDLTPTTYKGEWDSEIKNDDLSKGDLEITINGVLNKLTNKEWKYFNGNTTFAYNLINEDNLLNIDFVAGVYEIKNLKVYSLDYSVLENLRSTTDSFVIDADKTKGDIIAGSIDVREDGYFMLSVPYDKGFTVKVDGKETEFYKANGAFIGFDISAGKHSIEIEYESPLKKEGLILTICGILLFAGLIIIEGRRKNGKDNDNSTLL